MRIIYVHARPVEGCFTARSNVMHICYVTPDGKRVLYVLSQSEARDQMGRGTHIKNTKKNTMEMEKSAKFVMRCLTKLMNLKSIKKISIRGLNTNVGFVQKK